MERETFLNLPTEEIAHLVRAAGPKVCVFPINGTRRWFVLEHPDLAAGDFTETYLRVAGERHIELYKLFFDYGVEILLTPIFGPDLLERGDEYRQLLRQGLLWFAETPSFLEFYDAYDVRVRVYGDAERYLRGTAYEEALEAFDALAHRTADHERFRLFFGVCAHDPAETVAAFGIRFHQAHGRPPTREEIVAAYYGEYIPPVDFFIGFDRPSAFDMPLIATGNEDLYFTVSPSPYMDEQTLRAILYDHLYARRVDDSAYAAMSAADWQALDEFYTLNRHHVLGLGRQHVSGRFWYPTPQVRLPAQMEGE